MRRILVVALLIFITAFIMYFLKTGYCWFSESCGNTNHLEHIKTVAQPLKSKIDNFYKNSNRYPEWDEMGLLLEESGCLKLILTRKDSRYYSFSQAKSILDINGNNYYAYYYECSVKDFKLRINVTEFHSYYKSPYIDYNEKQLKLKKIGSLDLYFYMGHSSSCKLYLGTDKKTNMRCHIDERWFNWSA